MIARIWIAVVPGADRPYCSTTPPSPERKKVINDKGGKVFLAEVLLPGYEPDNDSKIAALAAPVSLSSK